jgi:agmatine deiminase
MIAEWETNCVYLPGQLPTSHPMVWEGLERALKDHEIEVHLLHGAKDIWLRDFLPIQITDESFLKFRYEPDYLRDHENLRTEESFCRSIPHLHEYRSSEINLDGGNIVASKSRVILTDKIFKANPGRKKREIRQILENSFRAECIFIPKPPYDPISHADGVLRFINESTVLLNDYAQIDPGYGNRVKAVLKKHGFGYEELPYFMEGETVGGIPSANGCYINYLRMHKLVIMPTFGTPEDERAFRKLEDLLPATTIIPQRCDRLAREGGVLNCISWCIRVKQKTCASP